MLIHPSVQSTVVPVDPFERFSYFSIFTATTSVYARDTSCSLAASVLISFRVHHHPWRAEHKIRLIKGAAPRPASALLFLLSIGTALELISSGFQGQSRLTPTPAPLLAVPSLTFHMLGHMLPPSFLHQAIPSPFPILCHNPLKKYFI